MVATVKVGGIDNKLYRNTGSYASPVWDLIPNVDDLTLDIETDQADASNRAGGGYSMFVGGLHNVSVEFGMIYDPGDTDYTTLRDAQLSRAPIEFGVADGLIATAGTVYFRFSAAILKGGITQALKEANKVPIKLVPAANGSATPAWVTAT